MDITLIYTIVGFGLAAYSVIANDSVQTLGTFIASNQRFKWYWLATAASAVLAFTLIYGWNINDGDIAFGRLNKIPYQTIQWYHAAAPLILVLLTRGGIPVSTSISFIKTSKKVLNILNENRFEFTTIFSSNILTCFRK